MALDPESPSTPSSSEERAEVYYRTGNALLAEIDARLSAGTPWEQLEVEVGQALVIACAARMSAGTQFEQLEAEVRQALAIACAYAGELLLCQPKKELH